MNKFHKNLSQEKWNKFSKETQILNIGAELGRAKNWLKDSDEKETLNCLNRAFELIDLTIDDQKWQKRGLKELLRLREVLAEFYLEKNKDKDKFIKIFRTLLDFDKNTSVVKI